MTDIKYVLPERLTKSTIELAMKKGYGWKDMDDDLLTQDCLARWLREHYSILIYVNGVVDSNDYEITKICGYIYNLEIFKVGEDVNYTRIGRVHKTYEKALEEGLKIGLNLIKNGK